MAEETLSARSGRSEKQIMPDRQVHVLGVTMVHDKKVATELSDYFVEVLRSIGGTVALVHESCTEAEYRTYTRAIGEFLAATTEILNSLYAEHPDLEPADLK